MTEFLKFIFMSLRMLLPPYGSFTSEEALYYRYGSIGLWVFCLVFTAVLIITGLILRKYKMNFITEHYRLFSILTAALTTLVYFAVAYFGFYR